MSISDLVRDIKNNSSKFINEQNFINENSHGRKDMALFPMLILKSKMCFNISPIRKSTTRRKHFRKNISIYLKNLISNSTKNICLIGWINNITHLRFIKVITHFRLYSQHPFGIRNKHVIRMLAFSQLFSNFYIRFSSQQGQHLIQIPPIG